MKIGFDAHVLDGRNQGTKSLMLHLINAAARRHPAHDFYVYAERAHDDLDLTLDNLHVRPTAYRGPFGHLLSTLPKAKIKDGLDTMIFNFISSPGMKDATVMMHDILPQTHRQYFSPLFVARCWTFFGISAFRARYLFTISDHSRREIKRVYPWTRNKRIDVLHIGPSFIKNVYFSNEQDNLPPELKGIGRYALCVGRMEPRKNTQMAIDAFIRGAPADAKLVIVGRREPGVAIDLRGDDRIIELGGVSDDALIATYRGADLFLYPSSAEGFGLPLLDAILFGLPVISSRLTSMAEVGGDCATYFDPDAPSAIPDLAQLIAAHFVNGAVPRPTLSQRQNRMDTYSWARAADELVAGLTPLPHSVP